MAGEEHRFDKIDLKKHVRTGSGEDGACLTRHIGAFSKSSCSHRWQAYRRANEYPHWYNYPAYHSLTAEANPGSPHIGGTVQWGHFPAMFLRPRAGEWDLGARSFGGKFANFQDWSKAPYWHQAHHLIPNSVMQQSILLAAETDMRLFWLVRSALLESKYNLNHKDNMILLPMAKKIAAVLGLPRHISGIEAEPGVEPEFTNHQRYNDRVMADVEKVLRGFAKQIDLKEHDQEAGKFARAQLERISTTLFMRLRVWAASAEGKSLADAAGTV